MFCLSAPRFVSIHRVLRRRRRGKIDKTQLNRFVLFVGHRKWRIEQTSVDREAVADEQMNKECGQKRPKNLARFLFSLLRVLRRMADDKLRRGH
jgi:hypothetical protein